jgi:hypothetical protein
MNIADVIRVMQWSGHPLATLHEIRSKRYPISLKTLAAWREQATRLNEIPEPLAVFNAFADFEESFEPFEALVLDYTIQTDQAVSDEIDRRRGK